MGAFFPPPPPPYAVIITEDHGGYVSSYENAVVEYNAENRRVEIRGKCNSACTLALGVKNVCVGKDVSMGWHQAYVENTHKIRSDITQHMLDLLPPRVKNHLNGKIQIEYTPETILHFDDLVSLGIPDCDAPSYKAPTVTAKVNYEQFNAASSKSYQEAPQPQQMTFEEQKEAEWAKYWEWAANQSRAQFGKLNYKKYVIKPGIVSKNIYYWDKNGMYVTAIEYTKNDISFERKVCRAAEVVPDYMTCTEWKTGKVINLEYDDFSGRYEEARQ